MAKVEYGLQMFSVGDCVEATSLRETLKKVAEAGYKYIEFCSFYGHTADEVKSMLDEFKLECISIHLPLERFYPDKIDETAEFCRTIGCDTIVIPGCDWSTPEKRDTHIKDFNEAQKKLEDIGMHLAYHNHDSEFMKTGYDIVFADDVLKKSSIDLEVDTFWLYNARVDVIEFFEKYKERITLLHIKDGIACKEENICFENRRVGVEHRPVGYGENDIKSIREWAVKNNVPMIVECENREPTGLDSAKKCIDYLKSLD